MIVAAAELICCSSSTFKKTNALKFVNQTNSN